MFSDGLKAEGNGNTKFSKFIDDVMATTERNKAIDWALADAINERVQPAVVFQDQSTMGQILQEYIQQYPIRSIDIFSTQKKILAHTEQKPISAWSSQNLLDLLFYRDPITLPIRHNNKTYGQLLVYGNSADLVSFFHKILLGLFLGFLIFTPIKIE